MKASQLIECLKKAIEQAGDLEVVIEYDGGQCAIADQFRPYDPDWATGSSGWADRSITVATRTTDEGYRNQERCFEL